MSDVLTITDLETAKKHDTFHSEVITGKAGGLASGADIYSATNAVTGQVQTTMPKILRDVGFKPASFNFVTGGTLGVSDADKCIYNPSPAGDDNWYSWGGALPHTVAPGTDPTADVQWVPRTDITLQPQVFESLRRSYADAGFTLVDGSFEEGGTLTSASDVLLHKASGVAYSGPIGQVAAGTDPTLPGSGYVSQHKTTLRDELGGDLYGYKQRHLLGEALKKLRERTSIAFTWYGDSNSVRNSAGVQTAFRGTLQGAYGVGAVNLVINRAVSGYSAKDAFETFTTTHAGDVSIVNFGTNDATTQEGYPSLAGNIQQYLDWIEKLIIRELNWGKPVVLVTPLPTRFDKAWETYTYASPSDPYPTYKRIDAYQMGNSLKYLAAKYSIPVIDSVELMAYFKDEMFDSSTQSINVKTPFGDPVHLADGYSQAWGARIAAQFIGDLVMRSPTVFDGDMLNVTHGASPVIVNSSRNPDAVYQYYADALEAAFAQGDDHVGNRSLVIQHGESVTFSFYTGQDNMIIYPTMMVFTDSNILTFIDNRSVQPQVKIDNSVTGTSYGPIEFTQITTSNSVVNRPVRLSALSTRGEANNSIYVPTKGWHTLTILCNTGSVAVSGLNFMTYLSDEFIKYKQSNPIGLYSFVVDYLDGDIANSKANGLMQYAFQSSTGKPTGVDAGFFIHQDNSVNDDGTISIIRFYESTPTAGRVWIKQRIAGTWGSWVQV